MPINSDNCCPFLRVSIPKKKTITYGCDDNHKAGILIGLDYLA
jgi:hypothetical protein